MSTISACFGRVSGCFSIFFLMLVVVVVGCSEGEAPTPAAETTRPAETSAEKSAEAIQPVANAPKPASTKQEAKTAARNPHERPLPGFEGPTLSGTRLRIADLLGTRILLYVFNPEVDQAKAVTAAVQRVATERGAHNFQVVGVGVGSTSSTLARFAEEQAIDFPIIDDSRGSITRTLGLRVPIAIFGIDAEGYMSFAIGSFPEEGDITQSVEANLRDELRIPSEALGSEAGTLYAYPAAPPLGVKAMSSGEVLETKDLAGQAAVVIFFLHTCPHCHHALGSLEKTLASIEEAKRPRLVAISIQNSPSAIRSSMAELGLDFFDPYLDPGGKASDAWGITGGVPVVFVLDKQSRIRHRSTGWDERRDAGIVRMKLAMAAGARVPMLLDPKGYSGNDVCGTCHEQEYATWRFTAHATAFDTLVTHGANRRTDCVGCHVVGFEQPGGYAFALQPTHLENVGCESCHGRGGPHLSPGFVPEGGYAEICSSCHTPTHSLGFDFASFEPRIDHARIAELSNAERVELHAGGGATRELLPTKAEYVGSNACQSCHEAEFETWSSSAHGHALASLERAGKQADSECLTCHTTAYGKPGGFPVAAPAAEHPDLARVGCESCHGPGGDHVGPNVRRVGTILSLGDKCDSCVILKVCGTCHDDANDPGFPFKVEERIEAQRHGTTPSAATRAGESAANPHPALDAALVEAAFERLGSAPDRG